MRHIKNRRNKTRPVICLLLCLLAVISFMGTPALRAEAEEAASGEYKVTVDCTKGSPNLYSCVMEKISEEGDFRRTGNGYDISPVMGSKFKFTVTVKKESGNIVFTESKNLNYEYRYEQVVFYIDINEATEHNIRLNFCIRGKTQAERQRDADLEAINRIKTGDTVPANIPYPINTGGSTGVITNALSTTGGAYQQNINNQYITTNGQTYTYLGYVTAHSAEKKPNFWRDSVAPVLAEFQGTIKMVTGFALAMAILTGILTLIINVIKLSAVPSHPIKRRQYIMDIIFNIICIALLGGINLLSRLAILIVIPSA